MSEAEIHPTAEAPRSKAPPGPTRTCVGCGERVDMGGAVDLVRLIVSPAGEVAVDARGGGFGRGAHVHARPECLRRAVERGLSRSAKARVHTLKSEATGASEPLTPRSLAAAIEQAYGRRIEGLLASAARSKQLVLGSEAVTSASQRGEAELIVVATDAAAAADLTAVRLAVADGRAVAWGSKERLGAALLCEKAGIGLAVLAITSRSLAGSLRDAIRLADACTAVAAGRDQPIKPSNIGSLPDRHRQSPHKARSAAGADADDGNSQVGGACAQPPNVGKLGAPKVNVAPRSDHVRRDRGWHRGREGAPRIAERAPTEDQGQDRQRGARAERGQRRDRRSGG